MLRDLFSSYVFSTFSSLSAELNCEFMTWSCFPCLGSLSGILLTLSEYSLPPSHILHSSFYLKSRAYILKQYYSLKYYWNVKFGPRCENIPIKSAAIGYSNEQETVSLPKDDCFIVTFSLKSSQDTKYFLRHRVVTRGDQGFDVDKRHLIFRRKISAVTGREWSLSFYGLCPIYTLSW